MRTIDEVQAAGVLELIDVGRPKGHRVTDRVQQEPPRRPVRVDRNREPEWWTEIVAKRPLRFLASSCHGGLAERRRSPRTRRRPRRGDRLLDRALG